MEITVRESSSYSIAQAVSVVSGMDYQALHRLSDAPQPGRELTDDTEFLTDATLNYGRLDEQFLSDAAYTAAFTPALDYDLLFSGEKRLGHAEEEEYVSLTATSDTGSFMMTPEEAEKTMREMEMDQVVGAPYDTNAGTRERMEYFILFHSELFHAFETRALTRNTNYGKL